MSRVWRESQERKRVQGRWGSKGRDSEVYNTFNETTIMYLSWYIEHEGTTRKAFNAEESGSQIRKDLLHY